MPTNKKEAITAANNTPKQQAIVSDDTSAPIKSKRKMSFKEFILDKNLRREVAAGFKIYVGGTEFMTAEEWNAIYNKYTTRK